MNRVRLIQLVIACALGAGCAKSDPADEMREAVAANAETVVVDEADANELCAPVCGSSRD